MRLEHQLINEAVWERYIGTNYQAQQEVKAIESSLRLQQDKDSNRLI